MQGSAGGPQSNSSQTTYEDDSYSYDWRSLGAGRSKGLSSSRRDTREELVAKKSSHPKAGKIGSPSKDESPLNTSGSSLTEEIFNTALSNLEFLSDEDQAMETPEVLRKSSLVDQVKI